MSPAPNWPYLERLEVTHRESHDTDSAWAFTVYDPDSGLGYDCLVQRRGPNSRLSLRGAEYQARRMALEGIRASIRGFIMMYVVYENPRDFPGSHVVRRHYLMAPGDGTHPERTPLAVVDSLDAARSEIVAVSPGAQRVGRMPADDPVIVEVWM